MTEPITHFNPPTSKNHLAVGDLWTPTRPTIHNGWDFKRNAPTYGFEESRLITGFFDSGVSKTNNVKAFYVRPDHAAEARCGVKTFIDWIRATGATVKRARAPEAVP